MIAARQIAFGGSAKGLSAKDYIQDGLVALVDGIENAGWGEHTDELKYTNLVTGEKFAITDNGNVVWGENCLKILQSGDRASGLQPNIQFYTSSLGISASAKDFTVGCALKVYDKDFGVLSHDGAFARFLGMSYEDNWSGVVSCAYRGDTNIFLYHANGETIARESTGVFNLNVSGFNWSNREVYSGGSFRFGRSYNYVCKSDIHCIRIYNRALTAEEIAYNYNIDKQRFGL